MSGKSTIGAILVVGGIVSGIAGYNKSQPSAGESFGSAALIFGSAMGDNTKDEIENIQSIQFKRGLPFYLIGCIAGVAGITLLVNSIKKE